MVVKNINPRSDCEYKVIRQKTVIGMTGVKTLLVTVTAHSRSDILCVLSGTMETQWISISDDNSLGSAHASGRQNHNQPLDLDILWCNKLLNTCARANWTASWMCSTVSTLRGLAIHLRIPPDGLIVTATVSGALNLTVTH